MKRFAAYISIFLIIASSAFAFNWFDDRYFEVAIDSPFGVSNNTTQVGNILTKEVVIDFQDLASRVPEKGADLNFYANPTVSLNLNARKFKLGLKSGVESWANVCMSKDLFEYIGYGNELYEPVTVSQKAQMDAFVYEELSVGFKIKKASVVVKPAFFVPVIHVASSDGALSIKNLEDGTLSVEYNSSVDVYTAFDFDKPSNTAATLGFDFAASVEYPLFDFLKLTGNLRVPVVPGTLNYKTVQTTTFVFETSANRLINGDSNTSDFSSKHSDSVSASYKVNRPLKFSCVADFTPFGDWLIFTGGAGMGFRHPFMEDPVEVFPEYYLGGTIKLLNILRFAASTQYYEQLFIHQLDFSTNARVLELIFAINTQSTDFIRSCCGGGIGGMVGVRLGF